MTYAVRFCKLLIASVTVLLAAIGNANAAAVQWSSSAGGNDHWYEVVAVRNGISWTAANAAAGAAGGYLATITSANENAFVFSLVDSPAFWNQQPGGSNLGPWLGGYQTTDAGGAAANWAWVSGEAFSFTNWSGGEPNNFLEPEDFLAFKCLASNGCRADVWNDMPNDSLNSQFPDNPTIAYVVEYNRFGNQVPIPGTAILVLAGLAGCYRRKA